MHGRNPCSRVVNTTDERRRVVFFFFFFNVSSAVRFRSHCRWSTRRFETPLYGLKKDPLTKDEVFDVSARYADAIRLVCLPPSPPPSPLKRSQNRIILLCSYETEVRNFMIDTYRKNSEWLNNELISNTL